MSRNTGNKSAAPRKSGTSLWTGMLVGVLVGAVMAAGVAWYLMKSPSPFLPKEPVKAAPAVEATKPPVAASAKTPNAPPTGENGKQRFEFYKVLTDQKNPTANAHSADKPKPAHPQPAQTSPAVSQAAKPQSSAGQTAAIYAPQILQAGSFSNTTDAEKLKAKLALLGVEANIQPATLPDKSVWYRVRLGPYKTAEEMSHAREFLKQNGVDSTPMRAQ